ncbi:MAG TPA: class I mannose-6-phosphate isomerase [Sphingomicrobium sp.]|jgi:mannose-6-phosphate isomerase|nr:class I mannose-6-phosphate isomerase [Sphingomicrobium sp.]
MTLELASQRVVPKPWGRTDLLPWSDLGQDGRPIGEVWFERNDPSAPAPALLLKLLFTDEPLSVQVHPDDEFARGVGLPNGKTEAWYVLSAKRGAQVALGLKRQMTAALLRVAIADGSISDLLCWHDVAADDALLVRAGTIHAIGAGLVIAEIQQRSDATFRLFDYGSRRELHIDAAVGASFVGPATAQVQPRRLSEARVVTAISPYFVLEQVDLAAGSSWEIDADSETWFLLLTGDAHFDLLKVTVGQAMFINHQHASIHVGMTDVKALIGYAAGGPILNLLKGRAGPGNATARGLPELASRRRDKRPAATARLRGGRS